MKKNKYARTSKENEDTAKENEEIAALVEEETVEEAKQDDPNEILLRTLGRFSDQLMNIEERLTAMEEGKAQLREEIVTVDDGAAVEIPDDATTYVNAYREQLYPPVPVTDDSYIGRYASKSSIDRRLMQGWQRAKHPAAREYGDLIPIEIKKDNPKLLARRRAKKMRDTAHEKNLQELSAQGTQQGPVAGITTDTKYERTRGPA